MTLTSVLSRGFRLLAVTALFSLCAYGQDKFIRVEAVISQKDDQWFKTYLVGASKGAVQYVESEQSVAVRTLKMSDVQSIFLVMPDDFMAAMDHYQARRYEEALNQLGEMKKRYRHLRAVAGNPSTVAAFYEVETLRRLGRYPEIPELLKSLDRNKLLLDHQRGQIELYALWEAYAAKSWERLEILGRQWYEKDVPGYQRAQAAFCRARAVEEQGRAEEALRYYSAVMVADSAASQELVAQAMAATLKIHVANQDVQAAMKMINTAEDRPNMPGRYRLMEAAAVAHLYPILLPNASPLPDELSQFAKFHSSAGE